MLEIQIKPLIQERFMIILGTVILFFIWRKSEKSMMKFTSVHLKKLQNAVSFEKICNNIMFYNNIKRKAS